MTTETTPAEKPATATPQRRSAIRRAAAAALRIALWTSLAIVIVVAIFIFTPVGDMAYDHFVICDRLEKSDCIIVLGGGYERVVEAANLYRAGWGKKIVFTSMPTDIHDMCDLAAEYGIPADAITLDSAARRTANHPETVAIAAALDKSSAKVIVITSPTHTSRAKACFEKAGYKNIIVRYPQWMKERSFPPNWLSRATHLPPVLYETFAWGLYKLRGWV